MRVDVPERLITRPRTLRPARVSLAPGVKVQRVRCVLTDGRRFLLVQNNSANPGKHGLWSLPGGRLNHREQPRVGLRREILEEIGFRVPSVVAVGDWWHSDQYHRVFACATAPCDLSPQSDEILACAWFTYADVKQLASDSRLRWGFEVEAISAYRRLPRNARNANA